MGIFSVYVIDIFLKYVYIIKLLSISAFFFIHMNRYILRNINLGGYKYYS